MEYAIGDLVWAKVRSFPAWPAKIIPEDQVPEDIQASRRKGSVKFFNVMFYNTHEFGLMNSSELQPYNDPEIKERNSKGAKSAKLRIAIKEADENAGIVEEILQLEKERKEYLQSQEYLDALAAEEEEEAKRRKKKATASLSTFSHSSDEYEEKRKRGRPRKNEAPVASAKRKSLDDEAANPRQKKAKPTGEKSAVNGSKTPNERLLALRHKLQRIFLGDAVQPEHFHRVDSIMTDIEEFPVTFDLLKESKIGKVVRRISHMTIENEPASVVSRCNDLLKKWRQLLMAVENEGSASTAVNLSSTEKAGEENENSAISSAVKDENEENRGDVVVQSASPKSPSKAQQFEQPTPVLVE